MFPIPRLAATAICDGWLAGGRIDDAVRRLAPRDRVWILNAKLREELDSWPA